MELTDYLAVLRKRWVSIVVITVLGLLGALAASLLATPEYEADTQVFVSTQSGATTASDLVQGSNFTQQQVNTYAQLVTTPVVLDAVIDELGLDTTPGALAAEVTADAPLDTSLITMTVTDADPARAAELANAIATSFITAIGMLEQTGDGAASPVKVTVVQPATQPGSPTSPNVPLNLALGLLVGLALGVGLAVLRETLDTTVRGERDVHRIVEAPALGGIAYDPEARKSPLVVQVSPQSTRAEAFRQLRTNLQFVNAAHAVRSLVVTSSVAGEGKTTTTANLAITLAGAGARVALVEGDLRRPTLGTYLGLEGAVGLTTVLVGRASLADVLQPWGASGRLDVVLSGQSPPNPSELLGSPAMIELLRELEADYDIVIVDAPPLLPVTDAAVLSQIVGGTLVVIGSGKVDRHQLTRSFAALQTVQARLLGYVLNLLPTKGPNAYEGYYGSDYVTHNPNGQMEEVDAVRPAVHLPVTPAAAETAPLSERRRASDRRRA